MVLNPRHPGNDSISLLLLSPRSKAQALSQSVLLLARSSPLWVNISTLPGRDVIRNPPRPSFSPQIIGNDRETSILSRARDSQQQALTDARSLSLCPLMTWAGRNFPTLPQDRVLVFSQISSHPYTSFSPAVFSSPCPASYFYSTCPIHREASLFVNK